jgi:hypothetical protein
MVLVLIAVEALSSSDVWEGEFFKFFIHVAHWMDWYVVPPFF